MRILWCGNKRMLGPKAKKWLCSGVILFTVGVVCLILAPYADYCESAYHHEQYECSPYEIITSILALLEKHNALIAAIATGFIAWFTWNLRQSTEKMWIETRKAANAADLSARAAVIVEFPIIRTAWIGPELLAVAEFPKGEEPYCGQANDGTPTILSVVAELEYRNYGRSPAFPIGMLLGYSVVDRLPEIPNYTKKGEMSPNAILKQRTTSKIDIHYGIELTEEDRAKIDTGAAKLWFFVRMTYLDIMDRPYFIGSCWQWSKRNPADALMYFLDDGTAPPAYTKRGPERVAGNGREQGPRSRVVPRREDC
jgi:hypothetical protein